MKEINSRLSKQKWSLSQGNSVHTEMSDGLVAKLGNPWTPRTSLLLSLSTKPWSTQHLTQWPLLLSCPTPGAWSLYNSHCWKRDSGCSQRESHGSCSFVSPSSSSNLEVSLCPPVSAKEIREASLGKRMSDISTFIWQEEVLSPPNGKSP